MGPEGKARIDGQREHFKTTQPHYILADKSFLAAQGPLASYSAYDWVQRFGCGISASMFDGKALPRAPHFAPHGGIDQQDGPQPDQRDVEKITAEEVAYLQELRRVLSSQPAGQCMVIIEPFAGPFGGFAYRSSFLVSVRALCNDFQALIVSDEVVTCGGRLGTFFAYEMYAGFYPDYCITGKGLVISSLVFVKQPAVKPWYEPHLIAQHLKQWKQITTTCGNGLAFLQSATALRAIREQRLMENATFLGKYLLDRIHEVEDTIDDESLPASPRSHGIGLFVIVSPKVNLLVNMAAGRRLMPALDITKEQIDLLFSLSDSPQREISPGFRINACTVCGDDEYPDFAGYSFVKCGDCARVMHTMCIDNVYARHCAHTMVGKVPLSQSNGYCMPASVLSSIANAKCGWSSGDCPPHDSTFVGLPSLKSGSLSDSSDISSGPPSPPPSPPGEADDEEPAPPLPAPLPPSAAAAVEPLSSEKPSYYARIMCGRAEDLGLDIGYQHPNVEVRRINDFVGDGVFVKKGMRVKAGDVMWIPYFEGVPAEHVKFIYQLDYNEAVGNKFFKFPLWELEDGTGRALRMLYNLRQNISWKVNHSRLKTNIGYDEQTMKGEPCVVYYAQRDIEEDEELFENYAYETDSTLVELFPWLLE